MIAFLEGEVLYSDGIETILKIKSGLGYQVQCSAVLTEGSLASVYISHIVREDSETLFGFKTLQEKKLFELLTSVKGVGPKSAFSLVTTIGVDVTINAIRMENVKTLTKAPGIGPKAAKQILLDLSQKIVKMKMVIDSMNKFSSDIIEEVSPGGETQRAHNKILDEALMACEELGFKEDNVLPVAEKILELHTLQKAEQLVHLVLKEM